MASRILNRLRLREQADQAAQVEQDVSSPVDESKSDVKVKKPRAKKASTSKAMVGPPRPRARKKALKVPPRMFARWAVCDGSLKQVAIFSYNDRAGADAKLIQLQEQKKGLFVIQLVKEAYVPPVEVTSPLVADGLKTLST